MFSTLISTFIFKDYWRKVYLDHKNKIVILLYIIPTLLLSCIVNILIKKPIYNKLYALFDIKKEAIFWPLWFLPIVLIVGSFAEEFIKVVPILLNKTLLRQKIDIYFSALLAGFGFGIGEIWYLAYRLSKTQPQYASGFTNLILLWGFGGERILAVLLHIILTGIVGYGFVLNQPLKYFFFAVLLHSLVNIPAGLYQMKKIHVLMCVVLIIIIFGLLLSYFVSIDENMKKKKGYTMIDEAITIYEK